MMGITKSYNMEELILQTLEKEMKRQDRSASWIVNKALKEYFERTGDKHAG